MTLTCIADVGVQVNDDALGVRRRLLVSLMKLPKQGKRRTTLGIAGGAEAAAEITKLCPQRGG